MQNDTSNFMLKVFLFFILFVQATNSQGITDELIRADSLFSNQNYKEAMGIYAEKYVEGVYSPAMLLKMAFVAEGIGDKEQATTYLGRYYDLKPDPLILSKLKTLTGQSTLWGYEINDQDRFLLFLSDSKHYLVGGLLLLLLVVTVRFVWKSRKKEESLTYWPIGLLIGLILIANNFIRRPESGLITQSPAFVVAKPTAGGALIDRVEPGHRVKILSEVDIWYEIDWKSKRAYIRKDQIIRL